MMPSQTSSNAIEKGDTAPMRAAYGLRKTLDDRKEPLFLFLLLTRPNPIAKPVWQSVGLDFQLAIPIGIELGQPNGFWT